MEERKSGKPPFFIRSNYSRICSEQNLYGTTYFISEAAKQQTIMYPPYMAYPGFNADTSLAFLERTVQQKTNARTSFFMGEEYRQYLLRQSYKYFF